MRMLVFCRNINVGVSIVIPSPYRPCTLSYRKGPFFDSKSAGGSLITGLLFSLRSQLSTAAFSPNFQTLPCKSRFAVAKSGNFKNLVRESLESHPAASREVSIDMHARIAASIDGWRENKERGRERERGREGGREGQRTKERDRERRFSCVLFFPLL